MTPCILPVSQHICEWSGHARAITAEGAMQLLDQAFREIRVRNEEEARYRR